MVLAQDQSSWIMLTVRERRRPCWTASIMVLVYTTVDITRTLESYANVSVPLLLYIIIGVSVSEPVFVSPP